MSDIIDIEVVDLQETIEIETVDDITIVDISIAEVGVKGDTGDTGIQGIQGETGPRGLQGVQGETGLTGSQGIQGTIGLTGETGSKGDAGSQGIQGIQGIQGEDGPQGIRGETGLTGAKGDTGETGLTGSQGIQGIQGATGERGLQGIQGEDGPQGIQGIDGPQGIQGIDGPQGLQGIQGIEGPQGPSVWGGISGSIADQTDLALVLAGKEPTIATKNSAFNVSFGTITGTAAQGDDTRFSDARAPTSHDNTAHSTAYATDADLTLNELAVDRITSTGLVSGCALTINGVDPTTYDMASGLGVIVDNWTDPTAPTRTMVVIPARTGLSPAYLLTDTTSYVFANISGAIVYNNYGSTAEDRRDLISIGWVDHPDNTVISEAKVQPTSLTGIVAQLNDFFLAFGPFNISGNNYGAASALTITRSAGETFDSNANYENERKSPHVLTTNIETPADILYSYRDGAGDWVNDVAIVTNVNPNNWDDNSGTLASVTAGYWTIQAIMFYAQTLSNDFQYGQAQYLSKALALSALQAAIDINPYNSYDTFRGWLIVQQGCTDLTNTATAEFRAAGKLGIIDVSSGGGTGGEVNTGSNINTVGTGVYDQKVGVDLQFKGIAGSGVISVTNVPATHSMTVSHTDDVNTRHISDTALNKLSGIATGAEVNVQADWNEVDTGVDSFIRNKPAIPASLTPSDTVTTETSFGQASNAGLAATYSRGDHTHGTPSASGGGVSEEMAIAYSAALGGI